MDLLKKIWEGWKKFAHKLGNFQARIILFVFYFIILAPFAMIIKRSDPMRLRKSSEHGWQARNSETTPTPEKMIRQW